MNKTELILGAVIAVLSFLGAVFGVYVGSRMEQTNWESRFTLEQKKAVLDKQIELLERMTVIVNKGSLINTLQSALDVEVQRLKLLADAAELSVKEKPILELIGQLKPQTEWFQKVRSKLDDLKAEWAASATLSAIYFAGCTQEALQEMRDIGPWTASDDQRQKLINCMGEEIKGIHK